MPAPKGHKPYKGCEKGGRPREWTDDRIEKEAEEFLKWLQLPSSCWFEQFAIDRGYPDYYLVEFSKRNKKFQSVYEYAKSWQKAKLVQGGLRSEYNSNICKLVLFNTVGWTDKQQIAGDPSQPLEFLIKGIDGSSKDLVDDDADE